MFPPKRVVAVDANVLLRYLLNDIPEQSEKARRIVDSDQPLGLTAVALAEIAWTLSGPRYRHNCATVARQLIDLLSRDNLMTLGFDKGEAQMALATCGPETAAANFGDALIAACARSFGVTEVFSFDQRFARTGMIPILPT